MINDRRAASIEEDYSYTPFTIQIHFYRRHKSYKTNFALVSSVYINSFFFNLKDLVVSKMV